MSTNGKINVSFELLKENYPDSKSLKGQAKVMADNYERENPDWTSCVIQMSVALNAVQELIPKQGPTRINDYHQPYFYMLSVVDFSAYLTKRYGAGEQINGTLVEKQKSLNGRQGILTIGKSHTELWDTDHHVQNGIDKKVLVMESSVLGSSSQILFWEVSAGKTPLLPVPTWLPGWWEVSQDGTTYYYSFSKTHTVTYTTVKPRNISIPAIETLTSGGVVTMHSNGATIVINWNPTIDGGSTTETFTRLPTIVESMAGRSNRFGSLTATKLK